MTFVLFVAVIVLLFWLASVNNRLGALERKIRSESKSFVESSKTGNQPLPHAVSSIGALKTSVPNPPSESMAKPKTDAENTETAVNWLNRVGIVAIVLGVAFFFKYAIDQGWIGVWMRIVMGLIVGVLLKYQGQLWKNKYGTRAQALTGGGIAVLYFTLFAGYQFYHILPQPLAFLCMLIVAGVSVWLSFISTSLTLAALGFFGAFGAPIMLSGGHDQYGMLFTYLTILNIALFAILTRKFWSELLVLGLFGTAVNVMVWGSAYLKLDSAIATVLFAAIVTCLYAVGLSALVRYYHFRQSLPEHADKSVAILQVLTGIFYFFTIAISLDTFYHNTLPVMALLGAILFFIAYALVDRLDYKKTNFCLSFAGAVFLVSANYWKFHGSVLSLGLLLTALVGFAIAYATKREELRFWSVAVLFVSLIHAVSQPYGTGYTFLFNPVFGLLLANAAAMFGVAHMYGKHEQERETGIRLFLQVIASLTVWFAVSAEIVKYYDLDISKNARNLFLSFWWIVWATVMLVISSFARSAALRKVALGLFVLSIVKVFAYDSSALDTGYRIVSFIVLGVILLTVSFTYQRNKERITNFLQG